MKHVRTAALAAMAAVWAAPPAFACASASSGYYDLRLREMLQLEAENDQLIYFIGRVVVAPEFGTADGTVHVPIADATIEILKASLDGKLGEQKVGDKVKFKVLRVGCFLAFGVGTGEVSLFATYFKDGDRYLAGVRGPSF